MIVASSIASSARWSLCLEAMTPSLLPQSCVAYSRIVAECTGYTYVAISLSTADRLILRVTTLIHDISLSQVMPYSVPTADI